MSEVAPRIPGWSVSRLLGRGAHAAVWLAREEGGLRRSAALKVFAAEQREKFLRELEVAGQVEELRRRARAPEIVQALGSGEYQGLCWIALEHLEAGSLADVVAREGPLPSERAARLVQEVARGLELLHAQGLFHRDVKPQNLLLGADGRARLADFGLARPLDGTLSAAGSPAFAAPELIAGRPFDGRRVDVYSLGATLAWLLSGETILPGRPDLFALERRGVPRPLARVVADACAADPEERIPSAEALAARLDAALSVPAPEISRANSGPTDGSSERGQSGPRQGGASVSTTAKFERDLDGAIGALARPRRTSKQAIFGLVAALSVVPSLVVVVGALAWVGSARAVEAHERGARAERERARAWQEREFELARARAAGEAPPPLQELREERGRDEEGVAPVVVLALGLPLGLEVAAIVLGLTALGAIRRSGGELGGRGLAIGGLVVAGLNLVGPACLTALTIPFAMGQPAPQSAPQVVPQQGG